ncbi:hypothetical protein [Leisingera sp. ANG-M1]|uniref:hypothetical protein n=1 Tax=Leisingera sp. ANG-M1 TaxID=1577895 RepID=UPI00126992C9|nr:hypothetical protein [Leisingera sp. ANG-M1]
MLDTVFQHRRKGRNTGDLYCSPGLYFQFGETAFLDFSETPPPSRLAVLGGGQVFGDCVNSVIYGTPEAKHRVIRGVGIGRTAAASIEFDILQGICALMSSRNWDVPGCEFVPCPSAMSPLFEVQAEPEHEVVLFSHTQKPDGLARVAGIPELTNGQADMEEALAFLASGEIVVANSYHGTFWAMCLGHRVLSVPFSDKFRQFRENPVFAGPQDWPDKLAAAETREGVLEDARARNRAFYEKVRNLG